MDMEGQSWKENGDVLIYVPNHLKDNIWNNVIREFNSLLFCNL